VPSGIHSIAVVPWVDSKVQFPMSALSFEGWGGSSEEPDEGKPQVRFCEGAHSSFREEVAMSSTRQKRLFKIKSYMPSAC